MLRETWSRWFLRELGPHSEFLCTVGVVQDALIYVFVSEVLVLLRNLKFFIPLFNQLSNVFISFTCCIFTLDAYTVLRVLLCSLPWIVCCWRSTAHTPAGLVPLSGYVYSTTDFQRMPWTVHKCLFCLLYTSRCV